MITGEKTVVQIECDCFKKLSKNQFNFENGVAEIPGIFPKFKILTSNIDEKLKIFHRTEPQAPIIFTVLQSGEEILQIKKILLVAASQEPAFLELITNDEDDIISQSPLKIAAQVGQKFKWKLQVLSILFQIHS